MPLSLVVIIVGLGLLTYSADHFVVGAGRVALRLQISAVVVGAVVVGFGTSAPELLVSATAAGRGDLDLGTGNVIGSVSANLSLVLGTLAVMGAVRVTKTTLLREAPLSIAAVLSFAWLIQGEITRPKGALLLVALVAALAWMILAGRGDADFQRAEVAQVLEDLDLDHPEEIDLRMEGLRTLAGLVGTVAGSQLLVEGATNIADDLGITSGFVGVSLVAIGTSLPELVTSVAAARRGSTDLIVGNLLGSNMFNGFAIGAAMGLIGPGVVTDPALTGIGTVVMVSIVGLSVLFMITDRAVVRWEGIVLLVIYVASMPLLAVDSEDLSEDEESAAVSAVAGTR